MIELRQAVFALLRGDATLTGYLGNGSSSILITGDLDPNQTPPLIVVYFGMGDTDSNTLFHRNVEIRCYDHNGSYYNIDTILRRVDTLILGNNLAWNEQAAGYGWCWTEQIFDSAELYSDLFKWEYRYLRYQIYLRKLNGLLYRT